ncbi:MAG: hypothetical protein SangKO_002080 [Sandaracinaceae bacterium]
MSAGGTHTHGGETTRSRATASAARRQAPRYTPRVTRARAAACTLGREASGPDIPTRYRSDPPVTGCYRQGLRSGSPNGWTIRT